MAPEPIDFKLLAKAFLGSLCFLGGIVFVLSIVPKPSAVAVAEAPSASSSAASAVPCCSVPPSASAIATAHANAATLLKRLNVEPDGEIVCDPRSSGAIECIAWVSGDFVRLCCSGATCSPRWCE